MSSNGLLAKSPRRLKNVSCSRSVPYRRVKNSLSGMALPSLSSCIPQRPKAWVSAIGCLTAISTTGIVLLRAEEMLKATAAALRLLVSLVTELYTLRPISFSASRSPNMLAFLPASWLAYSCIHTASLPKSPVDCGRGVSVPFFSPERTALSSCRRRCMLSVW